ncbi:MAG: hypothetical protein ACW99J_04830, partial [Candidatus Thorarchaeota archaeon]
SGPSIVKDYRPSTRVTQAPALTEYNAVLENSDRSASMDWFQIANRLLMLYDMPGESRFRTGWLTYLKRANVAALVIKSDKAGVVEGKRILHRYKRHLPRMTIALANFQDMPGALPPPVISRFLNVETYGVVGIDEDMEEMITSILQTAAVLDEGSTQLDAL